MCTIIVLTPIWMMKAIREEYPEARNFQTSVHKSGSWDTSFRSKEEVISAYFCCRGNKGELLAHPQIHFEFMGMVSE